MGCRLKKKIFQDVIVFGEFGFVQKYNHNGTYCFFLKQAVNNLVSIQAFLVAFYGFLRHSHMSLSLVILSLLRLGPGAAISSFYECDFDFEASFITLIWSNM